MRVDWDLEEAVMLVDLYEKCKGKKISDSKVEIKQLSRNLNNRARVLGIPTDDKYRNFDGIVMKLENIRYIDSDGSMGLSSYSTVDKDAYYLQKGNPNVFKRIVTEFLRKYE